MRIVASLVARELNAIAPHLAGNLDRVVEQLAADAGVAQVVADMHRLDLGAPAASMLDVTEGEQLEHADHVDAVVDGDEHRRMGVVLDLAQCVQIVVSVLGSIVVSRRASRR